MWLRDRLRSRGGIAHLSARLADAFVINPDGVIRTKALEPSAWPASCVTRWPAEGAADTTGWELLLSRFSPPRGPAHDAFVADQHAASTVDLRAHRGESTLEDVDLGEEAA